MRKTSASVAHGFRRSVPRLNDVNGNLKVRVGINHFRQSSAHISIYSSFTLPPFSLYLKLSYSNLQSYGLYYYTLVSKAASLQHIMVDPSTLKNDVVSKAKSTATEIADDLPPRHKLPEGLQKIVDKAEKDESIYDELWDGTYVSPFLPDQGPCLSCAEQYENGS